MSIMNTVIKNPRPTSPKGIIYGRAGIGKTTFAGMAPNSLIIDCENGAGNVPCRRTPFLDRWDDIQAWLNALLNEDHGYEVVAIDSLDWLLRRMEEHVNGHSLTQTLNKSHGGYGNGKNVLRNHIYQELLPKLNRIVERGAALVLIAHARRIEITDLDGTTIERTAPEIPPDFLPVFVEWADFVCLAESSPNGRFLNTGSENDGRIVAKNRYCMPPRVAFEWDAFLSAVREGTEPATGTGPAAGDAGNVKALAADVRALWRHMAGDKVDATLQWLGVNGVEQLAEANRSKLSQLRNRLLEMKAATPPDDPDAGPVPEAGVDDDEPESVIEFPDVSHSRA